MLRGESKPGQRANLDIVTLHASAFLSSVGVLLVAPYLAVYLRDDAGLSPAMVGLTLGLSFWSNRVSGLLAGWACARLGALPTMQVGNAIRATGYVLLLSEEPVALVIGLVLIGLGSGLFFPSSKALLLDLASPDRQMSAMAWRNAMANTGAAVGPLLGLLVFSIGADALFLSATAAFTLLALLLSRIRRPSPAAIDEGRQRQFVWASWLIPLLVVAALDGVAAVLLESTLPLLISKADSANAVLTGLFVVNGLIVIVAQPVGLRLVRGRCRHYALRSSLGMLAVATLSFSTSGTPIPLWLAGVVLLALAEVCVGLWLDDRVRVSESPATVYGLLGTADAFGGLAGAAAGAWLITQQSPAPLRDAFLGNGLWILGVVVACAALALRGIESPRRIPPSSGRSDASEKLRSRHENE